MDDLKEWIEYTIKRTIHALKREGTLRSNDSIGYSEVSRALYDYYRSGEDNAEIRQALETVSMDEYARIIPMYYGTGMTIDAIAADYGVDVSTIVRNKKRLCLDIYTGLGKG